MVITELKQFTYEEVLKVSGCKKVANLSVIATVKCISLSFKVGNIYIPVIDDQKRKEEYSNIRKEFDGHNHAELAIKYGRSLQWIYRVLKGKMRAELKNKKTNLMEVIEDYLPKEFILLGVPDEHAKSIGKEIARHLIQKFPGISFNVHQRHYE